MLIRLTKLWVAIGLLIAVWSLGTVRRSQPHDWIRPIGTRPGPVRIVQFYASVRAITAGDKAMLCSRRRERQVGLRIRSDFTEVPFIPRSIAASRSGRTTLRTTRFWRKASMEKSR